MDGFKIQELRAAVLNDLREFIPKDYYRFVRTNEDMAYRDITLANRLNVEHYNSPQLTPRQLAAVWLLTASGRIATSTNRLTMPPMPPKG